MARRDKRCAILENHRCLGYGRVDKRDFNELRGQGEIQKARRDCSETLILP